MLLVPACTTPLTQLLLHSHTDTYSHLHSVLRYSALAYGHLFPFTPSPTLLNTRIQTRIPIYTQSCVTQHSHTDTYSHLHSALRYSALSPNSCTPHSLPVPHPAFKVTSNQRYLKQLTHSSAGSPCSFTLILHIFTYGNKTSTVT